MVELGRNTYVHVYVYTYVYTYIHTYIHTYVYIHTYIQVRPRGAWVMDLMRADGVEPDLITFTTILDACVRAARDGEDGGRGMHVWMYVCMYTDIYEGQREMAKTGGALFICVCVCMRDGEHGGRGKILKSTSYSDIFNVHVLGHWRLRFFFLPEGEAMLVLQEMQKANSPLYSNSNLVL